MAEDIVRILRVIEYTGTREAVETQVANSMYGEKTFMRPAGRVTIRVATLGTFPEILTKAYQVWPPVAPITEVEDGA